MRSLIKQGSIRPQTRKTLSFGSSVLTIEKQFYQSSSTRPIIKVFMFVGSERRDQVPFQFFGQPYTRLLHAKGFLETSAGLRERGS